MRLQANIYEDLSFASHYSSPDPLSIIRTNECKGRGLVSGLDMDAGHQHSELATVAVPVFAILVYIQLVLYLFSI